MLLPRPLPTLIVFSFLALVGAVDGLWTNRWTVAETLQAATARLATVPNNIGDWDGRALELDSRLLALIEASSYVRRNFVNRRTGDAVVLLLLCGRPGPLSVHTPEACYGGAGFVQVGERHRYTEPTPPAAEFWVYTFQKRDSAVPAYLRIFCSWSASGAWQAVDNPRLAFAREPVLHKLYIAHELTKPDQPLQEDPSLEFIRVLLPALQKSLFAGS